MTLYKYLPLRYGEQMVSKGTVLFRSLLYFLACEDARRDDIEGTHLYEPLGGLDITNHTQARRLQMPGSAMRSSVKRPDQLFVFCTSRVMTQDLATKFGSDACIEIADVAKFFARLRTALRRDPRVKLKTAIHRNVDYYRTDQPPEEVWALPDRIVMNKPVSYAGEQEHRFAFSLKADAFDFQNVDMKITTGATAPVPAGSYPEMLVKLGSLADCCRICRF